MLKVLINRPFCNVRFLGNLRDGGILKTISAKDFYGCVDDELSFDLFLRYIEDRKTIIEFYSELLIDKKSVNICF